MRSGNPALQENTFLDLGTGTVVRNDAGTMSLNGTVNKTGILLLLTVITATYAWSQTITPTGEVAAGAGVYLWGGVIGGLVLALMTVFKKTWSPITAPLYAVVEGFFLGAISAIYNAQFQGIVMQAVMLTFGIMFALLFAYRSGLIKATENFKLGVVAATGGVALIYLATIGLGFFGIKIPFIHESGLIGIGFSLVVVVIASLNLVLDFDFIEKGVEVGAPKYMEWYGAFGLDGHAGLAVSRTAAPAVEAAVTQLGIQLLQCSNEKGRRRRPFSCGPQLRARIRARPSRTRH